VWALCAYLITALPAMRRELRRWRRLAEAIPDPERRRRALSFLEEKRGNAEAVAVFATLAPIRRRRAVLRAIIPLQLAIDYRDILEEAGEDVGPDPYLIALETGWVREIERLAGCNAIAPPLHRAVERCAQGQLRTHAAAAGDAAALQRWAQALEQPSEYRWWELAAGASSSVAAHALIAAAADPAASAETAARIDAAYNPSVGALTVLLDDLVDREADEAAGEHNYLGYYESDEETRERLQLIADRAAAQIEGLPQAQRHRAILAGVLGYYLGAPVTGSASAQHLQRRLLAGAGPGARLIARAMRLRRLFAGERPGQPGKPLEPLA